MRTYPEGTPFTGRDRPHGRRVGGRVAVCPPGAAAGAPNVVFVLLDDVGLRAARLLRRRHPHADVRPARRRRPALPRLPHDRHLLAHARVPAHRAQPPLQRRRHHPGDGDRVPRLQRHGAARERLPLRDAARRQGYATFAIGKWHLDAGERVRVGRVQGALAARRAASSATTASSAARPTSGCPRWSTTTTTSIRRARPEEGYHLNADLADRAIEFITDLRTVAPDKPFFMYYCLGAGHAPHHVEPEWIERYRGPVRQGLGPLARGSLRAPARDRASSRRARRLSPRPAVGEGLGLASPPTRGGSTRGRWRCTRRSSSRPTTTSAA